MPEADLREARPVAQTAARVQPSLALGQAGCEAIGVRPGLPAWLFVGLSAACVCAMIVAGFLGVHDCRVEPIPFALGLDSDVSIELPANTPCTILVRAGSAVVDDITVNAPPERGTLTSRGRTGVVYRPSPGFQGGDAFGFSLRGRSNTTPETSVVHVRAIVN
jgi:hypothetical protein